ncbi:MAG TPA: peptidase S8, partial [Segetibacter sp.]
MHSGKNLLLIGLLFINGVVFGQTDSLKGWHLLDKQTDSLHGISINKAYDFLKNRKSSPVIVAVIDSGVDTTNEDLKNILWRNPKEIATND